MHGLIYRPTAHTHNIPQLHYCEPDLELQLSSFKFTASVTSIWFTPHKVYNPSIHLLIYDKEWPIDLRI